MLSEVYAYVEDDLVVTVLEMLCLMGKVEKVKYEET